LLSPKKRFLKDWIFAETLGDIKDNQEVQGPRGVLKCKRPKRSISAYNRKYPECLKKQNKRRKQEGCYDTTINLSGI